MAKKVLVAKLITDEGEIVYVSKAGGSFYIKYHGEEKLCHPSIRSLQMTSREASVVFHVTIVDFEHC